MNRFLIILFIVVPFFGWGQTMDLQTMSMLANQYYQSKEYSKAGELYKKMYEATKSESYFSIFLDCLLSIPDYEKAEKEIRNGMRNSSSNAYWAIQLGYLYETLGRTSDASKMYDKALVDANNPGLFPGIANQFLMRRKYDYAEELYLKGRKEQNPTAYSYELARVYIYMRNYDLMVREFLEWAKLNEGNLEVVKSSIQSILMMDNDGEISKQIKNYILKRLQDDPGQIITTRLLIWLFIQEKNFAAAARQSIALDKRTGTENANIFNLAAVSASNKNYEEAVKAYDYIINKGKQDNFYEQAIRQRAQMFYQQFLQSGTLESTKAVLVEVQFSDVMKTLPKSPENVPLIVQYAHLLSFYLDKPADAVKVLSDAMVFPGLNLQQISVLKAEMSDIHVYSGDLWEAVITYSQVIETNKSNLLGDETKLKKAKLGYYMGNFSWAKAQLDVLKASTSKLISNDAMELALFIGENIEADSLSAPLKMFARADLNVFRNHFSEALVTLDSISRFYPFHALATNVNFRKAMIFQNQGQFAEAAVLLETIVKENSWEMLADDAIFQLAAIYETRLNRKDEAIILHKRMLTDYPGSVYVVDARAAYRKLQSEPSIGNQPEKSTDKEDDLFNGKSFRP